jgi:hypothetical protein
MDDVSEAYTTTQHRHIVSKVQRHEIRIVSWHRYDDARRDVADNDGEHEWGCMFEAEQRDLVEGLKRWAHMSIPLRVAK